MNEGGGEVNSKNSCSMHAKTANAQFTLARVISNGIKPRAKSYEGERVNEILLHCNT